VPPRVLLPALGLTAVLLAGCSAGDGADRRVGDGVTRAEAGTLAELLHRNYTQGGADFVVTAPYGEDAVLTLTGEVDFRHETGQAQAVTSFGDSRPDDTRTLFFTHEDMWVGTPGLPEALAAAGAPGATYVHRPLTAGDEGTTPPLVDALIEVLLNLSSATPDDARSFMDAGYTWEGQRSIDSRLTSLFGLKDGRTVAVAATNDLLTQFVTPLAGGEVDVTVTLSDHGSRTLPIPTQAETAEAADHPEIATTFGM
jgi:hypothetical protein